MKNGNIKITQEDIDMQDKVANDFFCEEQVELDMIINLEMASVDFWNEQSR